MRSMARRISSGSTKAEGDVSEDEGADQTSTKRRRRAKRG
jgi:hypothetical protein